MEDLRNDIKDLRWDIENNKSIAARISSNISRDLTALWKQVATLGRDFDRMKSSLADRDTKRVNKNLMRPGRVQDATRLPPDVQQRIHSYQRKRSRRSKSRRSRRGPRKSRRSRR